MNKPFAVLAALLCAASPLANAQPVATGAAESATEAPQGSNSLPAWDLGAARDGVRLGYHCTVGVRYEGTIRPAALVVVQMPDRHIPVAAETPDGTASHVTIKGQKLWLLQEMPEGGVEALNAQMVLRHVGGRERRAVIANFSALARRPQSALRFPLIDLANPPADPASVCPMLISDAGQRPAAGGVGAKWGDTIRVQVQFG